MNAAEPTVKQQQAIEHNVRRMNTGQLYRELHWLETQVAQPPMRRAMIREIRGEIRRRAEAGA